MKEKLPPGQKEYDHMVAMPPIGPDYPHVSKEKWRLKAYGEVDRELEWDWASFQQLPHEDYVVDFHCVTRWSRLGQSFAGVPFKHIVELAKPAASVEHVIFECYDDYTTNVLYQELLDNQAFIADKIDGDEIPDKYGGPARVVIPHLYGWKSAKFVKAIRFQSEDEPGFWEVRGYHNHGDPWQEERFS